MANKYIQLKDGGDNLYPVLPNCINKPGTYTFQRLVMSAYNTGSGNYVDCLLPIFIDSGLTISQITLLSGTYAYFGTTVVNLAGCTATIINDHSSTGSGKTMEIAYGSTQTKNVSATILAFMTIVVD